MTLSDKIKIWFQIWAPKHAITRLVGKLASAKLGGVTTAIIKIFIKQYKINMNEALHSDPAYFKTFNDFFIRELQEDARSIVEDSNIIVHPADACVSQFGPIENGLLIQAKSHHYSAQELLGGDTALYDEFKDGSFATLYLSPSDYHRVHMPCNGVLRKMIYVPGDLYSVNPLTAENIPNLFARNERVVCIFDTDFGPMAQILVGATIVGSIDLIWAGTVTPPRGNTVHSWDYPDSGHSSISLNKGDEMGLFKLGSTVINLFAKEAVEFDASMANGVATKLGSAYAKIKQ